MSKIKLRKSGYKIKNQWVKANFCLNYIGFKIFLAIYFLMAELVKRNKLQCALI